MWSKRAMIAITFALLIKISVGNANCTEEMVKEENKCKLAEVHADMGYVISGVRDVTDLSTEEVKHIKSMLVQNGVVVIEKQNLTRKQQVDFTTKLGKIVVLPASFEGNDPDKEFPPIQRVTNFWSNGTWKGKTNCFGCYWHKDGDFQHQGYMASMLFADEVSENRSTTLFLDNCEVFERLSKDTKQNLARTVFTVSVRNISDFSKSKEEDLALFPQIKRHRGIYRHPENGRKCAYVIHTLRTEHGVAPHLAGAWLEVTEQSEKYTHYWKKGDLVIWDNLAVMHRAGSNGFIGPGDSTPRMLYRTQAFLDRE